jgi:SAM-dependent methyltransferase
MNRSIANGRARYGDGLRVEELLEGGLAAQDASGAYGVREGVPQLMPDLRIVRSNDIDETLQASSAPTGPKSFADLWADRSLQWPKIGPPLRPAPQDVELCERIAARALGEIASPTCRALLLGVTPEVATMRWRHGARLLAVDSSAAMIRNVWPRNELENATVALADWTNMPVLDETYDIVIGDGSFNMLTYPEPFFAFTRESRRVLRDAGTLVMRVFARPEKPDSIASIFGDLLQGRTRDFNIFRWRLSMALHGDLAAGTRFGDVWEAWHDNVPDPQRLMRELGWGPHALQILEGYKGAEFRTIFPTVREFRELLADGFDQTACHVPEYEDGDRYPTLVFRAMSS